MAYSDYAGFVYCNDERRSDREDTVAFDGTPANEIYHVVLGDGPVRVLGYKEYLPVIMDFGCKGGPKSIDYGDCKPDTLESEHLCDPFDVKFIASDYKEYKVTIEVEGKTFVWLTEPDGCLADGAGRKKWYCHYGYYGRILWDDLTKFPSPVSGAGNGNTERR